MCHQGGHEIAFIVGVPGDIDLEAMSGAIFVPMLWTTELALKKRGLRISSDFNPQSDATLYRETIGSTNAAWRDALKGRDENMRSLNSYLSWEALHSATWIQKVLNQALCFYSPNRVWIPRKALNAEVELRSHDDYELFVKWVLYRLIDQETVQCKRKYFDEDPINTFFNFDSKFQATKANPWLERYMVYLSRSLKRVARSTGATGNVGASSIILLSQKNKHQLLTRNLRARGLKAKFWTDDCLPNKVTSPLTLDSKISVQSGAIKFLEWLDYQLADFEPAIKSLAQQVGNVFITTHHYDARVRLLMRHLIESGKECLIIPEGAVPLEPGTVARQREWFDAKVGATRTALSKREQLLVSTLTSAPTLVGGYFAKSYSRFLQEISGRCLYLFLILTSRKFSWKKKTLFIVGEPGVYISSSYGQIRSLEALEKSLSEISSFNVICKVRHHQALEALKERFPRWVFFQFIPWQLLASSASIVVFTLSSVGIEAIRDGRKVIRWKPHTAPLETDFLNKVALENCRDAYDSHSLSVAVAELLRTGSRGERRSVEILAQDVSNIVTFIEDATKSNAHHLGGRGAVL